MFQFKISVLGRWETIQRLKQFKLKEMLHPVYLHLNDPNMCSIRI